MFFSRKTLISCFLILVFFVTILPISTIRADSGNCKVNGIVTTNSTSDDCTKAGGTWTAGHDPNQPCTYLKGSASNAPCVGSGLGDKGQQVTYSELNSGGQSGWCPFSFRACLSNAAYAMLGFFSLILGLAAILMNLVFDYTILNMSEHLLGITAISTAWSSIRDLINLSFIFILLFVAIRTILGLESPGKMIKNIVLAALFINFSMFFTRVLIDVSNTATIFFLSNLATPVTDSDSIIIKGLQGLDPRAAGLVNSYVLPLRLQTIYSPAKPTETQLGTVIDKSPSNSSIFFIGTLGSLMLGLVAFVFFVISIMFIIRYAALVIILIFSPLGFISGDLPMIGQYHDQWWKTLRSQLLFPPIFMILTWVVLRVINHLPDFSNGSYRDALASAGQLPDTDSIGMIMNFLIIITLIIMSIVVTLQTAQEAGGALSGLYKKTTKWAGGMMFGGAGFLGRKTLGAAGYAVAQSNFLKDRAGAGGLTGRLAMAGLRTADYSQKSSFDVRGSGFGKGFAEQTGLDAGKASGIGGKKKQVEEEEKTRKEREKLLEYSKEEKDRAKLERARRLANAQEVEAREMATANEEEAKLKEEKEKFEKSEDYQTLKKESDSLARELGEITNQIKTKQNALSNADATGNIKEKQRIQVELENLNKNKAEIEAHMEDKKRGMVFSGDAAMQNVQRMKDEAKRKRGDVERQNKEEESREKAEEKRRKSSYATQMEETPDKVEENMERENAGIIRELEKLNKSLEDREKTLLEARSAGDTATVNRISTEMKGISENITKLEKERARRDSRLYTFTRKILSINNKNPLSDNQAKRRAAAAINAGMLEKGKAQKLYDDFKKAIEDEQKTTKESEGGDKNTEDANPINKNDEENKTT